MLATGMYIPSFSDDLQWATPGGDAAFYVPRLIEEDEPQVLGNISDFKEACTRHDISYRVHGDLGAHVLEGIRRETRFADLLIIGLEIYNRENARVFADDDLRQIIENSECPVLLVPPVASFPENIIIAYDGTEGSVHALKMFSYIFPEMSTLPAMVVFASSKANEIPEGDYIKELAARHFSQLSFSVLEFNPKKYFVTWMEERPKPLLVAGAYGRSELSQLFKRSFIRDLLEEHPVPVFIAHK